MSTRDNIEYALFALMIVNLILSAWSDRIPRKLHAEDQQEHFITVVSPDDLTLIRGDVSEHPLVTSKSHDVSMESATINSNVQSPTRVSVTVYCFH